MSSIKKIVAGLALGYLVAGTAASANELNVELNLGQPAPVYVAPQPVPVYPAYVSPAYVSAPWVESYDPHHRRDDWRYWDHERREHWEREHHEHWDHGHGHGRGHDDHGDRGEHGDHGRDHWDHR